jgi:predicted metal-dependent hydrolase
MIQLQKDKDNVLLSITTQLDREDVQELVTDLNKWLEDTLEISEFKGVDEEAVREAYQQAQSKLRLEKEMRRVFVDLFDSEYIEKMTKVYELDPKTKEILITDKKLKECKIPKKD